MAAAAAAARRKAAGSAFLFLAWWLGVDVEEGGDKAGRGTCIFGSTELLPLTAFVRLHLSCFFCRMVSAKLSTFLFLAALFSLEMS